jgi:SAM-dependent methyltransferase
VFELKKNQIRRIVRHKYGKLARTGRSCCEAADNASCCGLPEVVSRKIGYTDDELRAVPEGANLGLGCGNPVAIASLKEGETVLDLGSGAGFDCFLAANKVGKSGKIIGVDMTPEMIEKARRNAEKGRYENVEFRLGEIENLPAADNSVDVIISNCVINLSTEKSRVFAEAFRVLKPRGRLMISDIVLSKELPASIRNSVEAYAGCIAGAMKKEEYVDSIRQAGFRDVKIVDQTFFPIEGIANDPAVKNIIKKSKMLPEDVTAAANSILSVKIHGIKPENS